MILMFFLLNNMVTKWLTGNETPMRIFFIEVFLVDLLQKMLQQQDRLSILKHRSKSSKGRHTPIPN